MAQYFGAVGIPVTDLEASTDFYTRILGMVVLQTMEVPPVRQVVLGFEGVRGASVVLMKYTDGRDVDCEGNPLKLVFYVNDAAATLDAVRAANYRVEIEAEAHEKLGGAIIGFAGDPDGYRIELVQKPPKKPA